MDNEKKPAVVIVTPALADANNGNWQTARRWAKLLANDYEVRLARAWNGEPADALIALHARRSAASVAGWRAAHPRKPLVVALTGTDLYRDLPGGDAAAQRSLELADRLIVLHEGAPADVPAEHRAKCVVSFQSTAARRPLAKTGRRLRAIVVGHLRAEKDPRTVFAAVRKLVDRDDILIDHAGAALEPALGDEAQALAVSHPHYRWLGALPHAAVRARIQRAHVLVHPSAMEGGAHVVMEAIRSGTPVLASRIAGNVGLLGADYRGYFAPGDAGGLAIALQRLRGDAAMLGILAAQCDERAPLFEPARERATLRGLLDDLLKGPRERPRTTS
jgi:putative glycosyltransferase (TIGR04348 family)